MSVCVSTKFYIVVKMMRSCKIKKKKDIKIMASDEK